MTYLCFCQQNYRKSFMAKKVSIIIPTKNEEKNIGLCLKSLQTQTYKSVEMIVVDNFSSDKTEEIAQKFGVKVFQKGPERSSQRNFGAQKAIGNIFFFIDADMEIEKEVVAQAVSLLDMDKETAAIVVPEISSGTGYWAQVRALERSCYLNEPGIEAARIFRKEAFIKIGGFDKNLIAAEDWDLTVRIKKMGKIGRTSGKIIHHEDELSLIKHLQKKFYYAKNIKYYARKHPDVFKKQTGIPRIFIFARHWKSFLKDPLHAPGVIILKFLEYLTFIYARFL